jgi:hypothetical protein
MSSQVRTASASVRPLSGIVAFLAPLVALVAIWQATVTIFDVHPGIFPGVPAVVGAGIESIRDGSLYMHIGASFARVLVGPAAMIFTPCAGGLSRNEAESILPEEAEAGCQVLFEVLLARANSPAPSGRLHCPP